MKPEQQGAKSVDINDMEEGFNNIISVLGERLEKEAFLSGAGGGLAAGLNIFLNAEYKFAYDFIRSDLGINSNKLMPNIVITGEGRFDRQSYFNKAVKVVIDEFSQTEIPIFVVCGSADEHMRNQNNIRIIELEKFFSSKEESIKNFEKGLKFASQIIAGYIKSKL